MKFIQYIKKAHSQNGWKISQIQQVLLTQHESTTRKKALLIQTERYRYCTLNNTMLHQVLAQLKHCSP